MNSSTRSWALVTGSASGLGLQAARQLSRSGCCLILADNNKPGGEAAAETINREGGHAEFRHLDLGELSSIRRFAADELNNDRPIDILMNNAGLLPPMHRATTQDGFELAFGIAYLGHFALTGLLLPALLRSPSPRVVSVSSNSHVGGTIDFDNLQLEQGYTSSSAYTNSKLACLMFAKELQRRADTANCNLVSVAAHPGIAKTQIANGWITEGRRSLRDRFELLGYQLAMRLFNRDAAEGARSLVYAAITADLEKGGYTALQAFFREAANQGV